MSLKGICWSKHLVEREYSHIETHKQPPPDNLQSSVKPCKGKRWVEDVTTDPFKVQGLIFFFSSSFFTQMI